MKKLLLIAAIVAAFTACKKSDSSSGTTPVQYQYSASASGTYDVTYTDGDGVPVSTTFTGLTWSESVTANKSKGFKRADITMHVVSPNPKISGVLTILVNNAAVTNDAVMLDSAKTSFDYYALVY